LPIYAGAAGTPTRSWLWIYDGGCVVDHWHFSHVLIRQTLRRGRIAWQIEHRARQADIDVPRHPISIHHFQAPVAANNQPPSKRVRTDLRHQPVMIERRQSGQSWAAIRLSAER